MTECLEPTPLPSRYRLDSRTVRIWYTISEGLDDAPLVAAYERLMSADEREKCSRFRFPAGRHEYRVARALVRCSLSRCTGLPPGEWRFRTGEYGRPEIAGPLDGTALRFSLSHTPGLIACAVAVGRDVGIDVELTQRRQTGWDTVLQFFAPAEVAGLGSLSGEAWTRRFFELWTLKEAYLKARGSGLTTSLDQFAFTVEDDRIALAIDPALADDPASWMFLLRRPTSSHVMALAVARDDPAETVSVLIEPTVPLWH